MLIYSIIIKIKKAEIFYKKNYSKASKDKSYYKYNIASKFEEKFKKQEIIVVITRLKNI